MKKTDAKALPVFGVLVTRATENQNRREWLGHAFERQEPHGQPVPAWYR